MTTVIPNPEATAAPGPVADGGARGLEGPTPVVGIGASAGGVPALQGFFAALAPDTGLAFVVVMHLDPTHESALSEILQGRTSMPVQQVTGRVQVEPNHVYVIAPGQQIVITESRLNCEPFDEPRGQRRPIDDFFRSLATARQDAIAIILSGSGTDGAVGVKAIKERGGLVLVQLPEEAEHDGMPRAAIESGIADSVAPVTGLAATLVTLQKLPLALPTDPSALSRADTLLVEQILHEVGRRTGHDFTLYKSATILRRLQRRLQLQAQPTLAQYHAFLKDHPDETRALFNDLLIGVTHFFRDREAWEALAREVLPTLFEGKQPGERVRVWSVGCSSGEEAYTLAMLLLEAMDRLEPGRRSTIELQLFASDLDGESLERARAGYYPSAIEADLSPERLARFFVKVDDHYRVRRELRHCVLFTQHSVLRDPPFSRLDLISCRNLLIYLRRPLQELVFDIFHYALRPERYLFLGSAESIDEHAGQFRAMDKGHRIYRAEPLRRPAPAPALLLGSVPRPPSTAPYRPPRPPEPHALGAGAEQHRTMLNEASPPSVLVNEAYQLLHLSESAGRYLQFPDGGLTSDLLKLVRPELQAELHGALFEALHNSRMVVSAPVPVRFNGHPHRVTLAVRPASAPPEGGAANGRWALVFFLEDELPLPLAPSAADQAGSGSSAELNASLQAEIDRLRGRLQAINEQYAHSTEELTAANEELQSINEEYRSTTEELETSKEELQSVNEELQTVNQELKEELEEGIRAHSDLENLMTATQIATLFLDRELRIQRYTPYVEALFHVRPSDRGRPISHLTRTVDYPELEQEAGKVLQSLVPTEREVRARDGSWYLVRLRPYRTVDDRIEGVVLTFVDISALKQADEALRWSEERFRHLAEAVPDVVFTTTLDGIVDYVSRRREEITGHPPESALGTTMWPDLIHPDDRAEVERLRMFAYAHNQPFEARYRLQLKDGGHCWFIARAHPSVDESGQVTRWFGTLTDVDALTRAEAALREWNRQLEARVTERTRQVEELAASLTLAEQAERQRVSQILHDDLQQQLYSLLMRLQLLARKGPAQHVDLAEIVSPFISQLTEALQLTRALVTELNPPVLESEGLVAALEWLTQHMHDMYGLTVHLTLREPGEPRTAAMRTLLVQMTRELLFNVVKHARVSDVTLVVQRADGEIEILLIDEGVGFDTAQRERPAGVQSGFGLRSIAERLKLIGGRFEIVSSPGEGTRVTLRAPGA